LCSSGQVPNPTRPPESCLVMAGGLTPGLTRAAHDRQIRSLVLYVGLDGPRRIWPAHVGRVVDPDGTRPVPSDHLDDQTDDQARDDEPAPLGCGGPGAGRFRRRGGGRPAGQLGAQVGGQAAASPVGSTGYPDRQAFRPPWSASAWKPSWRSCSAARALVCSRGQVQYKTKGWSRRRSAAHSAT
jgi:hypothetical protein